MANRRMFSLDVVDTDRFLEMPSSTQSLYFHLGMRADDEGFVSSPKKIMNMANCNNDDLKLLIAKNYLIPFESGVVVITDWKVNNWIRGDRKHETRFKNERSMLSMENDLYRLSQDCQPSDNQLTDKCHTEVRLGKDSIDKNNIYIVEQCSTSYPFQEIIEYLNQRTGKRFKSECKASRRHIMARFSEGFDLEDFKKVIDQKTNEWLGTKMERYLRPETLFGTKFEGYLNEIPSINHELDIPEEPKTPVDYSEMERKW